MATVHENVCKFVSIVEFFSEWEMFLTEIVEEIKTHILC
jgi:hypothetical protein